MQAEWPSFAESMTLEGVFEALFEPEAYRGLARIGEIYEANRPDRVSNLPVPTVPRTIHQIWLGSPLPRRLRKYSDTWRRRHPGWDFILWTDEDVAKLDFSTRDLFDESSCWAQKSDLLRAEILNQFGGVYVDLDYRCYKPLDELVDRYDFFGTLKNIFPAHLGWPAVWRNPVVICNSFVGARAGHPIFSEYLEQVRALWNQRNQYEFVRDELPYPVIAAMGGHDKVARIKDTGVRTFIPFSDVAYRILGTGTDRDIAFPPIFFNPVMAGARTLYFMPDFWQRCWDRGIRWPNMQAYTRTSELSIARHYSESRWL